jgi:hypothetical protein
MDFDAFSRLMHITVAPGTVFPNPAGGHSCNCTMLFILLKAIGAVDRIQGEGVRGDPFWVTIAAT